MAEHRYIGSWTPFERAKMTLAISEKPLVSLEHPWRITKDFRSNDTRIANATAVWTARHEAWDIDVRSPSLDALLDDMRGAVNALGARATTPADKPKDEEISKPTNLDFDGDWPRLEIQVVLRAFKEEPLASAKQVWALGKCHDGRYQATTRGAMGRIVGATLGELLENLRGTMRAAPNERPPGFSFGYDGTITFEDERAWTMAEKMYVRAELAERRFAKADWVFIKSPPEMPGYGAQQTSWTFGLQTETLEQLFDVMVDHEKRRAGAPPAGDRHPADTTRGVPRALPLAGIVERVCIRMHAGFLADASADGVTSCLGPNGVEMVRPFDELPEDIKSQTRLTVRGILAAYAALLGEDLMRQQLILRPPSPPPGPAAPPPSPSPGSPRSTKLRSV